MTHFLKAEDYHTQTNNEHRPMYECGNTTAANALSSSTYKWVYLPDEPLDNYFYKLLRAPIIQKFAHEKVGSSWASKNPEQSPDCLAYGMTMLTGKEHIVTYRASKELLTSCLKMGIVLVTPSHFYKGRVNGHYVLVSGLWEKGVVIDDPLANPLEGHKKGSSGYGVKVEWEKFLENFGGIAIYQRI